MRYRLLGATGLRVSEVALGTGTFGTAWGWGVDRAGAREIFSHFVDAGGNLFDCADVYQEGESETILGELVSADRDSFVVSTKFTGSPQGPITRSGNNRKHMFAAVESSLRRLGTDYIDIFMAHCWDGVTLPEELAESFDILVKSGKIRYAGLSNFPAWYASRYATLAAERRLTSLATIQLEYSLIERTAEWELLPMAAALDVGVMTYSPLAAGILAGQDRSAGSGRRIRTFTTVDDRIQAIIEALAARAHEIDCSPEQLAIAWIHSRSAPMVVTILGASSVKQLSKNLTALEITPSPEILAALGSASEPPTVFPSAQLLDAIRFQATAGNSDLIDRHRPWGSYW
jgi:aryl-alcohol dehydrogenase-like predicted oxidoreductase